MTVVTIEVSGWKENHVGWTGWDSHARTEVRKRLARAISASPNDIKSMTHQIRSRQSLILRNVDEKGVESLGQILETMGAQVSVLPQVGES